MAKPRKLYVRVGLLLLVGLALAIGFILFLTAGRLNKTAEIAETYFSESVTGLEVGAPVRYRGVRVGQVAEIGLVNAEYRPDSRTQAAAAFQLVLVRLAIDPARATIQNVQEMQRAVEAGLRARLASAGITGGSYVELDFVDPARFPPREVPWTPSHQVIPSMPSTVAQVQNAAEQLLTRVQDAPIEEILNNVASLTGALSGQAGERGDLARTLREAAETMASLRQLVSGPELTGTLQELRAVASNLNALTGGPEARRTLASISGAADGLRAAVARLPAVIENLDRTSRAARGVTQDTNADLAPILRDLRAVASNLRDTTELLRRAPGQAILGAPPPPPNR